MGLARRTLCNHVGKSGESFWLMDSHARCLLYLRHAKTVHGHDLYRLDLWRTDTQRLLGRCVRYDDTRHLGIRQHLAADDPLSRLLVGVRLELVRIRFLIRSRG